MIPMGYLGVDVVIDPVKGPLLLEMNARPGLSIQVANQVGLKKVLERFEVKTDLHVSSEERMMDALMILSEV